MLLKQMEDINKFILKPEVTFRLVLNPEKLSILETKRAYTFVHLYGINIDAIVVNKVLPTSSTVGEYFEFWSDLHRKYLMEIDNSFYPTPIFRCEMQRSEPIGCDALDVLSKKIFGDNSADKIFQQGKNFWIESKRESVPNQNREVLCIRIPFLKEAEDVRVVRMGTDISVTIDRNQRLITLPRVLYTLEMENFVRDNDTLRIFFKEQPQERQELSGVSKSVLDKLRATRKIA
jgi:arsenite-transporting ATPase